MTFFKAIANFLFIVILVLLLPLVTACENDDLITSRDVRLSFSTDTVSFDTIFTETGSSTQALKIYNRHSGTIRISSIRLAGSMSNFFRLNIDGQNTTSARNIDLSAGDSIFVFVAVYINPLNVNNPVLIKDSVIFETNGNEQDVKLIAYGQDVHLIKGDTLGTQTWIDNKPYLIYGQVVVDSAHTLTVEAGCDLYFHKNASLNVNGTLIINGTAENPVTLQNDRNEDYYRFLPGQWGTVYLAPQSNGNIINYAVIKNATTGIQAGNSSEPGGPDVVISNSHILNVSYAGLYASGAGISCYNTVFSGSAGPLVAINRGGSYKFIHCTFANHGVTGVARKTPSVTLSNFEYAEDKNPETGNTSYRLVTGDLDSALFMNCILFGNFSQELELNDINNGAILFNFHFGNCLLKVPESFPRLSDNSLFKNLIINNDPEFIGFIKNPANLRLDTLSPAKDAGDPAVLLKWPSLSADIEGNPRNSDSGPDMGAYERLEE